MSQSDFVTRGQALVASGQFQEAVKVCRLGLLGRPTTVEGRIVLGQALLALKRYDEVLAEMRVALELDHTSLPAQVLKADALLRKGDNHAAAEVLGKLAPHAGSDPRIGKLLEEAQRGGTRPSVSASHPAVGFLGADAGSGEALTKHYPNRGAEDEITGNDGVEDTGGNYTRPTSLSAPGSKKRSGKQQAMDDGIPSAAVLAVGDRSGTVEVDPESDGLELGDDDDFGEIAAPPAVGARGRAAQQPPPDEARGSVKRATKNPRPVPGPSPAKRGRSLNEISSVELDSGDVEEVSDPGPSVTTPQRSSGPRSAVRAAVKLPSGPLDAAVPPPMSAQMRAPLPPTAASVRPTAIGQAVPPPLAQQISQQPHMMQMMPPPQPLPPAPNQRGLLAASLPTAAAMQPPGPPVSPATAANAARPTIALNAAQQQSAAAVDALFEQPGWAKSTMVAGANEPTSRPSELDPRIAAMSSQGGGSGVSAVQPGMFPETSTASGKPLKTGVRKGRSKLAVFLWILIGAVVIGGGVFAGFQIRAMRLKKQIAAAHDQAVDLAKSDTWLGWSGARDRLAGIAQASGTVDNRSALARTRAILAYEFGDGLKEAKAALERLAGQTNPDLVIARAYVALADNDPAGAKTAADAALEAAPNDAAALYVAGQAALLAGDYKAAITSLKAAQEKEPRPLYAVGLARAIAMTGAWDDALAAVDRALGQMPDHPGAQIERALLFAGGGKLTAGGTITQEIRATLVKLTAEGAKPYAEQTRGVSPAQVALADVALAQVDFALHDMASARNDIHIAGQVGADEPKFAEEAIDTILMLGELQHAEGVAQTALTMWPGSRRLRIAQAQIETALGKPADALDILKHNPDAAALPRGLAARGEAKAVLGDIDGARADFDAALKKLPKLELAIVGRAWVAVADGELDEAHKLIDPVFKPETASIPLSTVYAAMLRASGDPAMRAKARAQLEKVTKDALPTPDIGRAQLELARVLRDSGDLQNALASYAVAMQGGNAEARAESGLLMIENKAPHDGREVFEQILKDAGDKAPAGIMLETVRARMLDGANADAATLLDQAAEKVTEPLRWKYDRERGRLALRRNDIPGAAQALSRALEGCGADTETFLLSADTVGADTTQAELQRKLKQYLSRLKDLPEAQIVSGKLALAAEDNAGAEKAYSAAAKALANTTPRRIAQASFGLAAVFYFKKDYPNARLQLDFAIPSDPTLFAAYLFSADVEVKLTGPPALPRALELAKKSVQANPDYVDGWVQVGTYAAALNKRRDLDDAIAKVGAIAPLSEALKDLQGLKK